MPIDMDESESTNAHRCPAPTVRLGPLCWIGFSTFLIRSYEDIVTNFMMTIAPPAVTTALYFVVFGTLIGQHIGNVNGQSYSHYIAPGLIMLPIITGSYGQAGLAFVVAKIYRQIDEQLVSPQPRWMIVVNYVSGGALRGIIVGIVAGILTLLFTHGSVQHVFMTIAVLLMISLVSSLAGFMNGLFAKSLDQVTWVSSFVLTPLTYLGGVFYSVAMLPAWAQKLSLANPIFYLVNLCRYSMLGTSDGHLGISVFVMLFAAFAMFAVAASLVERGFGISE
jgi:ABC-2 type transport system permease protein